MKDIAGKKIKRMADLEDARRYHPIQVARATVKEYQEWFKNAKPVFELD
jgi:hypothetical protein